MIEPRMHIFEIQNRTVNLRQRKRIKPVRNTLCPGGGGSGNRLVCAPLNAALFCHKGRRQCVNENILLPPRAAGARFCANHERTSGNAKRGQNLCEFSAIKINSSRIIYFKQYDGRTAQTCGDASTAHECEK